MTFSFSPSDGSLGSGDNSSSVHHITVIKDVIPFNSYQVFCWPLDVKSLGL